MDQQWNLYPEFTPAFTEIMNKYHALVSTTITHSTARGHITTMKDFFRYLKKSHPAVVKLSDLKRSPHIEGWLTDLASRDLGKATRKLRIMSLRKIFQNIYEWEWEDFPQPGMITPKDMPHLDDYLPKPLTPEADMKLQNYLRGNKKLLPQALLLLRKTGIRIGELRDLDLECMENISDGNYVLHVPIGKLHSERVLPVDPETVNIIKHIIDLRPISLFNPKNSKGRQYLITNRYCRRPSYTGLRSVLGRLAIQSGIHTPISPHMLRHTYATELLRGGINLVALMKLMGHKDISMTLRYTRIVQEDIKKAYHAALENSKSLYGVLRPEKTDMNSADDGNLGPVLGGIANAITKIESLHKDTADKTEKRKVQRLAERLRRIYKDLEQLLKVN